MHHQFRLCYNELSCKMPINFVDVNTVVHNKKKHKKTQVILVDNKFSQISRTNQTNLI